MRRWPGTLACLCLVLGGGCEDEVSAPHGAGTDHVSPRPVVDLALAYDGATDAVQFTWTAPRDDLARDRVDHYEIRVAYAEPFVWDRSAPAPAGPEALPAGSRQSYLLADAQRGRDLLAGVRAYDAAGNESPLSNIARIHVPGVSFGLACVDALGGTGVPRLGVQVTATASWQLVTDDAGHISLLDVSEGAVGVRIGTGAAHPYHALADAFDIHGDRTQTYWMIEYTKPASPQYASGLQILLDALVTAGQRTVIKKWTSYPVPWYAGALVNSHGIDYRAVAERAAARWNERVGQTIFAPVITPPATGVVVQFLPRSVMGVQNGLTVHSNDAGGYPLLDRIQVVDDFADEQRLYTIMLHEFGHAVRLSHLPSGFIMYGGQPLPADISDDEVSTVRLLLALPNDLDLAIYDAAPPR